MNLALLLFALRVLSALLLLGLLAGMAWLIYQELRVTQQAVAQRALPTSYLCVLSGDEAPPARETRYALLSITTIGRAAHNTIVLPDAFVSAEHARLQWRSGQWYLTDLASRNGTLLNDTLLHATAVLSAGDVIAIGDTRLLLEMQA